MGTQVAGGWPWAGNCGQGVVGEYMRSRPWGGVVGAEQKQEADGLVVNRTDKSTLGAFPLGRSPGVPPPPAHTLNRAAPGSSAVTTLRLLSPHCSPHTTSGSGAQRLTPRPSMMSQGHRGRARWPDPVCPARTRCQQCPSRVLSESVHSGHTGSAPISSDTGRAREGWQ